MTPLKYYTVCASSRGYTMLLTEASLEAVRHLGKRLSEGELLGRVKTTVTRLTVVAELEGEVDEEKQALARAYDSDEIAESIEKGAPDEIERSVHGHLISERVLHALECAGLTGYRAAPVRLWHVASGRTWPFWLVWFTNRLSTTEISGDETCFMENNWTTHIFFSEAAKTAIARLDSCFTFQEHHL